MLLKLLCFTIGLALPSAGLATTGSQKSQPAQNTETTAAFSFHLSSEPQTLNPALFGSTDSSYLFFNVYRGLYRYHTKRGLVPEGARRCDWKTPRRLHCQLRTDVKWSDGQAVTASDYVRAFRNLVRPDMKVLGIELLRHVKGALDVSSGRKPLDTLGVQAPKKDLLTIEFEREDPDFLYKLSSPILVPVRSAEFPTRAEAQRLIVNGPWRITSWVPGRKIQLQPNPHYDSRAADRPTLEVYFVDDDSTAMTLYEEGRLKFLRRLPTALISSHKARPDFHQVPLARFDYIGFGPDFDDDPELRKALSLSLDFEELRRLYDALGIPGCPSLPESYLDRPRCLSFDLKAAKEALQKVPKEKLAQRFKLGFSKLGGDDVRKGAEWIQAQWRKNLGLKFDLQQTEQGVFLQQLRTTPPSAFRKGVGLDRPTCLSALETFAPGGSENFLRLNLPTYETHLNLLALAPNESRRRALCGEGVQMLLDTYRLIPLGRIHFSLLASTRFTGWHLNEMNQLDLTDLRPVR